MNKRTEDLMLMLSKQGNVINLIESNREEFTHLTLTAQLQAMLDKYNMKKADVINRSGLNQIYAYQIFAGTKNPSRDKLIALMLGFPLKVTDGNMLLKAAGMTGLYPRNKREAVVIFGLNNKLTVCEIDDILFELGEETIM